MELEFKTEKELYDRLLPALKSKYSEMKRMGYEYIKIEDIWNFLKETKWKKGKDLELFDLINDILNAEEEYIDFYVKEKLNKNERHLYFSEQ